MRVPPRVTLSPAAVPSLPPRVIPLEEDAGGEGDLIGYAGSDLLGEAAEIVAADVAEDDDLAPAVLVRDQLGPGRGSPGQQRVSIT